MFSGIPGRAHTRCPTERIDFEPGVIGNRRQRGRVVQGTRFESRVVGEGLTVLDDVGDVRRPRYQLDRIADDGAYLGRFVRIGAGQHDTHESASRCDPRLGRFGRHFDL